MPMTHESSLATSPDTSSLQTAEVLSLDCVTFDVKPGIEPGGKPPVRIFLGSEEAQQRAERIFLYTVHKLRDPARVYHVYLMKNLPGFDRTVWRTGFTQYRFAIPELAGGHGRAIYNDVDQIYLKDPAELFDLEMGDHGYLAVDPIDTSVTLMDCARMLPWWNMTLARQRGKHELVRVPAAEPGLWGALAGGWNARDVEYEPGVSGVLHYTALHLQPWRPTPDAYSYHPNPVGGLWFDLLREADAEGYQPFTRQQPSGVYRRLMAEQRASADRRPAVIPSAARDFLADLGIAEPALLCSLDGPATVPFSVFNPALDNTWPDTPVPAVAVSGLLERLTTDDIPWCLDALFALAQCAVHLQIDLRQATVPADRPAPARVRSPAGWWRNAVADVAARHPGVAWQFDLTYAGGTRQRFRYVPAAQPPRVWVLLGRRDGDNEQLLALAEALGWPYETRQLVFRKGPKVAPWLQGASLMSLDRGRSQALEAPWPDLVLAIGGRSAPVARWIRQRSGGTTRLVHLGRPRAPLDAFDLVVSTPQYRLPARDNVLHNVLPLNRLLPGQTERSLAVWRQRVETLPRPRIALLAGGGSTSCVLDETTARQVRERAEALARARGGSLLITTSPRTTEAAADALLGDSDLPGLRYRWQPDDADSPYPAFLALADEIIVTGDSASMLAEACATGRPVRYVPLRHPRPGHLDPIARFDRTRTQVGERGTPRQQDKLGRWLDEVVSRGLLRPSRDMTQLYEALQRRGLAQALDDPAPAPLPTPNDDLDRTVAAVRRVFLSGRALPA